MDRGESPGWPAYEALLRRIADLQALSTALLERDQARQEVRRLEQMRPCRCHPVPQEM